MRSLVTMRKSSAAFSAFFLAATCAKLQPAFVGNDLGRLNLLGHETGMTYHILTKNKKQIITIMPTRVNPYWL
jgi:hypothetical protein